MLTLVRRRARSATLVAASMVAAPTAELEFDGRRLQGGSALAGVIGHWTDTSASGPAIVANGEKWSGQTPSGDLQAWSRRLFGAVHESFVKNGAMTSAFPIAVVPSAGDFSSGTLRVQFNLLGGKSDQIAGLMFGFGPSGDYHYVRYNTKDGNLAVWRVRNGEREVLAHGEVHKQLPLNTWHELEVRIDGSQVSGRIVGDTTIAVRHTLERAPVGRVGVQVKRDAITAFRGFTIRPDRP